MHQSVLMTWNYPKTPFKFVANSCWTLDFSTKMIEAPFPLNSTDKRGTPRIYSSTTEDYSCSPCQVWMQFVLHSGTNGTVWGRLMADSSSLQMVGRSFTAFVNRLHAALYHFYYCSISVSSCRPCSLAVPQKSFFFTTFGRGISSKKNEFPRNLILVGSL